MKSVRSTPLLGWFLTLFLLNLLDIATTMPAYESNPLTLCLWGQIGIFLSAWVKIGLVILFGVLCLATKKVATAQEWNFTRKVYRGVLIVLVIYYVFVVAVNLRITLLIAFS